MIDAVIIGAGPAGLTACYFASAYGLNCVCIGDVMGGKLIFAPRIVDYPGVLNIDGKTYIANLLNQVSKVKGNLVLGKIQTIDSINSGNQQYFRLRPEKTAQLESKVIILATGNPKKQKKAQNSLFNQLGLAGNGDPVSVADNFMTELSGVFACGDLIDYPRSLEQLTTACATGAGASAAVYTFLTQKLPPIVWGESLIRRTS